MSTTRRFVVACALVTALGTSVLTPGPAESGVREVTIEINDFAFTPQTISVPAGTVVTWINKDETPHTVVEAGRRFKSRVLDTGGRFSYTAAAPGTFSYFCSLHPHMTARLVVEPPAS